MAILGPLYRVPWLTMVLATAAMSTGAACTVNLGMADAKLVGDGPDDWAGRTVAAAGDVNGDGYDDILVGLPEISRACLVLGPVTGTHDLSEATATFVLEGQPSGTGTSVSTAGDTDGDGYDDLFLGAPFDPAGGEYSGAAFLVLGPVTGTYDLRDADAKLVGEAEDDRAGTSVSAAGDTNGDGFDDLLVGAPHNDTGGEISGAAYLILGPVSGTVSLANADAKFVGEEEYDYAGISVSSAGDTDADGYTDLLVGAPEHSNDRSGAAYLIHGPVTGALDLADAEAKLVGEDNLAGTTVATAGDVNGDGNDDLLVGTGYSHSSPVPGMVYLVLGPVSGTVSLADADAEILGQQGGDSVGSAIATAGDVNGDGFADLLLGAKGHDAGGDHAGAAYLVHGPVSGTVRLANADVKYVGERARDSAGSSVSSAGDTNGDGFDDLLVGAPGYGRDYPRQQEGFYYGAAYLILGGP